MTNQANTYQAYYRTNVQTSDQVQLIIMMYEGMIRFMKKANKKIEEGDIEGSHNYILRSKEIISELLSTLKVEKGGDIGKNLKELYIYSLKRLTEANLSKDTSKVDEVISLMNNVLKGWQKLKEEQTQRKQLTNLAEKKRLKVQG